MATTPSFDQLLLEIIKTENVYSVFRDSKEFSTSGLISKAFVFSFIKKLVLMKFDKPTMEEIDTFIYNRTQNEEDQRRLFEFFVHVEELQPSYIFSSFTEESKIDFTMTLFDNLIKLRTLIREKLRFLNKKVDVIENRILKIQDDLYCLSGI